jgi:predicted NACHT family NTPase
VKIILGPPGTGKTTKLLSLVESYLEKGVEPDRIGYFAFTRRAANEAVERLVCGSIYQRKTSLTLELFTAWLFYKRG